MHRRILSILLVLLLGVPLLPILLVVLLLSFPSFQSPFWKWVDASVQQMTMQDDSAMLSWKGLQLESVVLEQGALRMEIEELSLESDLLPTVWSFWKTDVTRVRHLFCRARIHLSNQPAPPTKENPLAWVSQLDNLWQQIHPIALADGMLELAVVFPGGETLDVVIRFLPSDWPEKGGLVVENLTYQSGGQTIHLAGTWKFLREPERFVLEGQVKPRLLHSGGSLDWPELQAEVSYARRDRLRAQVNWTVQEGEQGWQITFDKADSRLQGKTRGSIALEVDTSRCQLQPVQISVEGEEGSTLRMETTHPLAFIWQEDRWQTVSGEELAIRLNWRGWQEMASTAHWPGWLPEMDVALLGQKEGWRLDGKGQWRPAPAAGGDWCRDVTWTVQADIDPAWQLRSSAGKLALAGHLPVLGEWKADWLLDLQTNPEFLVLEARGEGRLSTEMPFLRAAASWQHPWKSGDWKFALEGRYLPEIRLEAPGRPALSLAGLDYRVAGQGQVLEKGHWTTRTEVEVRSLVGGLRRKENVPIRAVFALAGQWHQDKAVGQTSTLRLDLADRQELLTVQSRMPWEISLANPSLPVPWSLETTVQGLSSDLLEGLRLPTEAGIEWSNLHGRFLCEGRDAENIFLEDVFLQVDGLTVPVQEPVRWAPAMATLHGRARMQWWKQQIEWTLALDWPEPNLQIGDIGRLGPTNWRGEGWMQHAGAGWRGKLLSELQAQLLPAREWSYLPDLSQGIAATWKSDLELSMPQIRILQTNFAVLSSDGKRKFLAITNRQPFSLQAGEQNSLDWLLDPGWEIQLDRLPFSWQGTHLLSANVRFQHEKEKRFWDVQDISVLSDGASVPWIGLQAEIVADPTSGMAGAERRWHSRATVQPAYFPVLWKDKLPPGWRGGRWDWQTHLSLAPQHLSGQVNLLTEKWSREDTEYPAASFDLQIDEVRWTPPGQPLRPSGTLQLRALCDGSTTNLLATSKFAEATLTTSLEVDEWQLPPWLRWLGLPPPPKAAANTVSETGVPPVELPAMTFLDTVVEESWIGPLERLFPPAGEQWTAVLNCRRVVIDDRMGIRDLHLQAEGTPQRLHADLRSVLPFGVCLLRSDLFHFAGASGTQALGLECRLRFPELDTKTLYQFTAPETKPYLETKAAFDLRTNFEFRPGLSIQQSLRGDVALRADFGRMSLLDPKSEAMMDQKLGGAGKVAAKLLLPELQKLRRALKDLPFKYLNLKGRLDRDDTSRLQFSLDDFELRSDDFRLQSRGSMEFLSSRALPQQRLSVTSLLGVKNDLKETMTSLSLLGEIRDVLGFQRLNREFEIRGTLAAPVFTDFWTLLE